MKDIVVGKRKNLFHGMTFIVIFIILFLLVQEVISPKWYYPQVIDSTADSLDELYSLPKDSVQALFIGTSAVQYSVDPMRIYELNNYTAVNLSTPDQPIKVTYALLKEAFRTQSPKVVFLDVNWLFEKPFFGANYRYTLDDMHFGKNKIELAKEYANNYEKDKKTVAFLSAFFPMFLYHDRWNELGAHDFDLGADRELYRKGYFLFPVISGCDSDTDSVNSVFDEIMKNAEGTSMVNSGLMPVSTPYFLGISQDNLTEYLKIKQLCKEHEVDLVLIKIPSAVLPQSKESWPRLRSDLVKEISTEYDIPFLDLMYDYDLGIDWHCDTCDLGLHMNYNGANKVSDFFADYLYTEYGAIDVKCDEYEHDRICYDIMALISELQCETDFYSYLDKVSKLRNTTVFFSVCDDMVNSLSSDGIKMLHQTGLISEFGDMEYRDAFVGVVENGSSLYEAFSDQLISYTGNLSDGCSYELASAGWLVGSTSSIIIDGIEYSGKGRGINIVVFDNVNKLVIDSASFDTYASDDPTVNRDYHLTSSCLRQYEEKFMRSELVSSLGKE